jgi:hypothetical protein
VVPTPYIQAIRALHHGIPLLQTDIRDNFFINISLGGYKSVIETAGKLSCTLQKQFIPQTMMVVELHLATVKQFNYHSHLLHCLNKILIELC